MLLSSETGKCVSLQKKLLVVDNGQMKLLSPAMKFEPVTVGTIALQSGSSIDAKSCLFAYAKCHSFIFDTT